MDIIFEILHITIKTIAESVISFTFLIIIGLIYFMIKKSQNINFYGYYLKYEALSNLVESVLQGIIIGIIGSLIISILGLPVVLSPAIMLLLPIAIILSFIHPRFLCFSYAGSLLGCISLLLRGQQIFGITLPKVDIDIVGLMVLVGTLHLMESLLIYFVGYKYAIPIVSKKDNTIVFGYIMQRFWPIPISLLVMNMGLVTNGSLVMPKWWPILNPVFGKDIFVYFALLPIVGVIGYKTITFTYQPKIKARLSGQRLMIYSFVLLFLAVLSTYIFAFKIIGILFMVVMHEGLILFDQYIETVREPLYSLPKKGVRVLSVYTDGIAYKMGIEAGDIILKINGIEIKDSREYKYIIQEIVNNIKLEVIKINGNKKVLEYKKNKSETSTIGVCLLNENPKVIFKYNTLNQFSIVKIILKYLNKNI